MRFRARLKSAFAVDSGMTLVEVIVAISIMTIVATAAVSLVISSIASAASHQRRNIAITIANQSMELASAQSATVNPATGVSFLYQGRTSTDVHAAWTTLTDVSGKDQTYPKWDPTATGTPPAVLPISVDVTRSGTVYSTHMLIGACYQPIAGGDCTVLDPTTYPTEPPTAPAGFTQLIRVMVVVDWTAGSACPAAACTYQTTSLIDPHGDLQWNGP